MSKTFIRGTSVFAFSALAMAVAGQASAVSFDAGNTKVTIGGYIKGDMVYDAGEKLGATFDIAKISTGQARDDAVEDHFQAHARQSRLSIATSTPTETGGPVTTLIEGDFFGASGTEAVSNSHGFRLRHAFASYNGIGFGQTWSNFMPLVALPPTLDFGGPAGYIFNRQTQARYTTGGLSLALENPEARIAGTTADKDTLPDLTVRYVGKLGDLSYSASGVLNYLEYDDGTTDDSATGYAVMLAASTKLDGGIKIGGNIGYFDGANRYLFYGAGGTFNNAYVDGDGSVETVGELALMGFVDVPLNSQINAMLAVGYGSLEDKGENIAGAAETLTSVHANLRYKPVKQVTLGVEIAWAEKELFNGDDGDATRLQFSGQYAF